MKSQAAESLGDISAVSTISLIALGVMLTIAYVAVLLMVIKSKHTIVKVVLMIGFILFLTFFASAINKNQDIAPNDYDTQKEDLSSYIIYLS